jgi:hypothetical protein
LQDSSVSLGARRLHVCYLDYDGVVHDDAVYCSSNRGIYIRTPGCALFEWMHILDNLLTPYPKLKIVLSTSWVRSRSFEFAKKQLSPTLQARVIGATFHNRLMQKRDFDQMSRGHQVLSDVGRRQPTSWFAIDNDDFEWPDRHRGNLIKTEDRLGLSDTAAQESVRDVLKMMNCDEGAPPAA